MTMKLEQITYAKKDSHKTLMLFTLLTKKTTWLMLIPNTNEIKKEFYDYTDWVDSYDIFGKDCAGHTASS
jgi:hypothetical protein